MEFLQKIGGRKFIMALIAVGVATAIEIKTDRGLSVTMAGLLGSLVAAFSLANYANTASYNKTILGKRDESKLDEILENTRAAADPEVIGQVQDLLSNINVGNQEIKNLTSTLGQTVLGLAKEVQVIKKNTSGM